MSKIEAELQGITDVRPSIKAKEMAGGTKRQDYLFRILEAVEGLKDDDFNKLTEPTQDWVSKGNRAYSNEKAIPEFPDLQAEDGEGDDGVHRRQDELKTEQETEVASTKKAGGKASKGTAPGTKKVATGKGARVAPAPVHKAAAKNAPAGKKAAAAPAKAAARPAVNVAKPDGIKDRIKKAVLKNPSITTDALYDQLTKKGEKISELTVAQIRGDFRRSLHILKEGGFLKGVDI